LTKSVTSQVKLFEAYTRDVGRGVIRIDYDTMDKLNCSTGDTIQIKGKRKSVAKVLPLYPSDENKGMARGDKMIRKNLRTIIGNRVQLKKIIAKPAVSILYKFIGDKPPIDERYLADALESNSVIKGDNVLVPYFGGRLELLILDTQPKGAVVISQKTVFYTWNKKTTDVHCPTCGQVVL